jgi:hypothetical protein
LLPQFPAQPRGRPIEVRVRQGRRCLERHSLRMVDGRAVATTSSRLVTRPEEAH